MKLSNKSFLYYLIVSIPIMLVAAFTAYYIIKSEIQESTDEFLMKETYEAHQLISSLGNGKKLPPNFDHLTKIERTENNKHIESFSNSIIYDSLERESVEYRKLISYYTFKGQNYRITVLKESSEGDELITSLLSAFGLLMGILLISFLAVNWVLNKTLWKPFYKTIEELDSFDITKHEKHQFAAASIKEFQQLNSVLNQMSEKLNFDFVRQKEFTENASHEMQTPLAVIKANLSLLMQSKNLTEEDMNQLQAIENTTMKMGALNKALILLSNIENNQYKEMHSVDFNKLIENALNNFSDQIVIKNISLIQNLNSPLHIQMNPLLAEILINNLIQNAIRHNYFGGSLTVELSSNVLKISNTGDILNSDPEEFFVRFKKNDASKESIGLGLSIVKAIVSFYNFTIDYSIKDKEHTFILKF